MKDQTEDISSPLAPEDVPETPGPVSKPASGSESRSALDRSAAAAKKREQEALRRSREMARLKAELDEKRSARNASEPQDCPPLAPSPSVPFEAELSQANRIYGDAVTYARDFLDDVQHGKPVNFNRAKPVVDGFIDSIFRNESAASALCKLRKYDEYTFTHSINVSVLAIILGKKLGMAKKQLRLLGAAGMFHDVGKALIPDAILNKPGRLSKNEMDMMRTHPQKGYDILKAQEGMPSEVVMAALEHHERFDGQGYPHGLKGNKIHLVSRIISVVDVYDALTSHRVYRDPLPPGKVLSMLYQWRLSDFQPNIVEHFIKSLGIYPVGSFVRLTNGDYAVVTGLNAQTPLLPTVRVVFDYRLRPVQHSTINLATFKPAPGECKLMISDIVNPDEHHIDLSAMLA